MCGIAGIVSTERLKGEHDRKKFFKNAMIVSSMRGTDSAGLFMIPHAPETHDVVMLKRAVSPFDFVDLAAYHDAMIYMDRYVYTIGHTRAATVGKIKNVTAHPFSYDHIHMVHNGTLTNWRALVPHQHKFETDSDALCYLLATEGMDETLKKIEGAFAIVWSDANTGQLHMVRNDERPLHFGLVEGEETVVLASEYGMLKWLMERHDFKPEKVYEVAVGHVITLDPKRESIKKWSGRKVDFAPPRVYRGHTYQRPHNTGGTGNGYSGKASGGGSTSTNTYSNEATRMANLRRIYPQGTFVTFSVSGVNIKFGHKEGTIEGWTDDGDWTRVVSSTQFRSENVKEDMIYKGKVMGYQMDGGSWPTLKVRKVAMTDQKYEEPARRRVRPRSQPDWVEDQEPESLEDLIVGPNGSLINEATFNRLVRYGCVFCNLNIDALDADEIDWIKNDDGVMSPICSRCLIDNTDEVHVQ